MQIYDLADPQELVGFVRNIPLPQFTLKRFLPNVLVDDIEYRFTRGDFSEQDAAQYRAFDAEAPIGTRPGIARVAGQLPPISKKMVLGEEATLRLRKLQGQAGVDQKLVNQIFDDAYNLAYSIEARIEVARAELLFTGKVTINENGVAATLDFVYAGDQLPAAPGVLWTTTSSDIIGYLTDRVTEYQTRTGGERPGVILTSTAVRSAMLKNTQIAALAASLAGAPQRVTTSRLNDVLNDFDLPPVEVNDVAIKVGGVRTRITPVNKIALLPAPGGGTKLGRTFWGVTAEAIKLAEARQISVDEAPGMVAVVTEEDDPVATWTKVAGISIPTLANPELVTVPAAVI